MLMTCAMCRFGSRTNFNGQFALVSAGIDRNGND